MRRSINIAVALAAVALVICEGVATAQEGPTVTIPGTPDDSRLGVTLTASPHTKIGRQLKFTLGLNAQGNPVTGVVVKFTARYLAPLEYRPIKPPSLTIRVGTVYPGSALTLLRAYKVDTVSRNATTVRVTATVWSDNAPTVKRKRTAHTESDRRRTKNLLALSVERYQRTQGVSSGGPRKHSRLT